MRRDCTGEPPGELSEIATAGASLKAKAFSIRPAVPASESAGRSWLPPAKIAPCSRITGMVIPSERRRFGRIRLKNFGTWASLPLVWDGCRYAGAGHKRGASSSQSLKNQLKSAPPLRPGFAGPPLLLEGG